MRNQRFGKLFVKWVADKYRNSWECVCDCGKHLTTTEKALKSGLRVACETCQPRKAHLGLSVEVLKTRAGKSFRSARRHCTDHNCVNYPNYGARGIQFKFTNFKEWEQELGPCPKGYFLDRINPDGHYEKGNVRWIPRSGSTHNRRKYKRGNNSAWQHSQFRGVWRATATSKTWSALLQKDGIRYYLGTFPSEEDAGRAYDKKATELYGQYAGLNFPAVI